MSKQNYTDAEIVEAIKSGGKNREKAIAQLYNDKGLKYGIAKIIRNNKGSSEDAEEVFQEGIIILHRNVRSGKYQPEGSLKSYLISICRLHWMNLLRKKSKISLTDDQRTFDEPDLETPEILVESEERKNTLHIILEKQGERCREILKMWQLSHSMEEIAEAMGLSSALMARKAKYRCMKALTEFLKERPDLAAALR